MFSQSHNPLAPKSTIRSSAAPPRNPAETLSSPRGLRAAELFGLDLAAGKGDRPDARAGKKISAGLGASRTEGRPHSRRGGERRDLLPGDPPVRFVEPPDAGRRPEDDVELLAFVAVVVEGDGPDGVISRDLLPGPRVSVMGPSPEPLAAEVDDQLLFRALAQGNGHDPIRVGPRDLGPGHLLVNPKAQGADVRDDLVLVGVFRVEVGKEYAPVPPRRFGRRRDFALGRPDIGIVPHCECGLVLDSVPAQRPSPPGRQAGQPAETRPEYRPPERPAKFEFCPNEPLRRNYIPIRRIEKLPDARQGRMGMAPRRPP